MGGLLRETTPAAIDCPKLAHWRLRRFHRYDLADHAQASRARSDQYCSGGSAKSRKRTRRSSSSTIFRAVTLLRNCSVVTAPLRTTSAQGRSSTAASAGTCWQRLHRRTTPGDRWCMYACWLPISATAPHEPHAARRSLKMSDTRATESCSIRLAGYPPRPSVRIRQVAVARRCPEGARFKRYRATVRFFEGPPTANGTPGVHHVERARLTWIARLGGPGRGDVAPVGVRRASGWREPDLADADCLYWQRPGRPGTFATSTTRAGRTVTTSASHPAYRGGTPSTLHSLPPGRRLCGREQRARTQVLSRCDCRRSRPAAVSHMAETVTPVRYPFRSK